MKRIILLFVVAVLYSSASYAQRVQVNAHIFDGRERLYFAHPHTWMTSHGYRYNNNGYYVHPNGKRIQPNRREAYHRKGNNGNHYGQYKRKGHGYGKGSKYGYRSGSKYGKGNGNKYSNGNKRSNSNGHKQGKGHK